MFHVEQDRVLSEVLRQGARDFGLSLTGEALASFLLYLHDLLVWNDKLNLTAIRKEREIVVKHFLDSLACLQVLPKTAEHVLDIGTGAGFPGIPVKILCPEVELTLLEPSLKKTAFLHHVIGTLGLKKATVVSRRVEVVAADPEHRARYGTVLSRALEIMDVLPFLRPLLRPDGRAILWRARPLDKNMALPGLKLVQELTYTLPEGHGMRLLAVLEPITNQA
ncbi:MAG: 16S rRNA (guanine(527)-N(7))-methyltransferase RsmG [Nitrospirota bacterium]